MSELFQHQNRVIFSRRTFLTSSALGALGIAFSARSGAAQETNPFLRLTVVSGSDNPVSDSDLARYQERIPSGMNEIRAWYASQLDGQTFQFDPNIHIKTISLTTDQIRCSQNPLAECLSDRRKVIEQAWQAAFWNNNAKSPVLSLYKNIVDVFFLRGGGEQSMGGSMNSRVAGYAVIGDLGLEGLTQVSNELGLTCAQSPHGLDWQCTRESAKAAVAHELGHIAIPYNSHDESTVMGGNIAQGLPSVGFSPQEREILKQNIFFQYSL